MANNTVLCGAGLAGRAWRLRSAARGGLGPALRLNAARGLQHGELRAVLLRRALQQQRDRRLAVPGAPRIQTLRLLMASARDPSTGAAGSASFAQSCSGVRASSSAIAASRSLARRAHTKNLSCDGSCMTPEHRCLVQRQHALPRQRSRHPAVPGIHT